MTVWLVLKWGGPWQMEVMGIFTTHKQAIAACDTPECLMGEVAIDVLYPPHAIWHGVEFPMARPSQPDRLDVTAVDSTVQSWQGGA